jgi:tetratricopeptide (TPR) repeat protein
MRRLLLVVLLSLWILPARAADVPAADALLREGTLLLTRGQFADAVEKFRAAQLADPNDGRHPAMAAAALLSMSMTSGTQPEVAVKLRREAQALARASLRLAPGNGVADSVLQTIVDEGRSPLKQPTPDAARLAGEGAVLFARRDYENAELKYRAAMAADPGYSPAYVYAGDCYYQTRRWEQAAALFRQAAQVEPMNAQAWRFLADALVQQGKLDEAEAALYAAIGAQPGLRANWHRLAVLLDKRGVPLSMLEFEPKAAVEMRDGAPKVLLDRERWEQGSTAEAAAWTAYGMAKAAAMTDPAASKPARTPYQVELEALRGMLRILAEAARQENAPPLPAPLVRVRAMADAGQLEQAVLLLMYREAYRPDLEAWKAAHPDGVRQFIASRRLTP